MKKDEKCENCKYFVRRNADEKTGECHRHAPHPSPLKMVGASGIVQATLWPEVNIDSCCGEFEQEARKEPPNDRERTG